MSPLRRWVRRGDPRDLRSGGGRLARRWGPALALALAIAGVGVDAARAAAQDIEAVARLRGIELPAAYWARVAEHPDAFTLPHGVVTAGEAGAATAPVTGEARLPVILGLFVDSPEPHLSPGDIDRALFSGPAERGTVTDFYTEISGGRFTFRGDVLPWVRTSLTREEVVADSYGLGFGAQTPAYLLEALALNDPDVDFGIYDNDGPDGEPNTEDDDGYVDVVTFEFLEVAASCGGPGIWPHRSALLNWGTPPYVTDDPRPDGSMIRVNGYVIQGATDCSGESVQTAGTIAHELGHALGLPDYYHPIGGITPDRRRWVLGCWALMAAGSWGCGEVDSTPVPFGPTHMISWSKQQLGWLDYDEVGSVRDAAYELPPVDEEARGLRVPLDPQGTESLLLEYRRRVSFDADLPAEGVLLSRQDDAGALRPNSGDPYRLRVVEADGEDHLLRTSSQGGNRGDPGDIFGIGTEGTLLHNSTVPSLRRNGGLPSTVTIHSIELSGGRAHVRLSTAPDPVPLLPEGGIAVPAATPVESRFRIAGGAGPWQVSLPEARGLTARTEGDEVVLTGQPDAEGVFDVVVRLVDALGTVVDTVLRLAVGTFQVVEERLVGHLVESDAEPLTAAERDVLDEAGNANGRFDVGDVRARLLGADARQ